MVRSCGDIQRGSDPLPVYWEKTTDPFPSCPERQEVKVLSPQHGVGKQVGKGHGREGGSFLRPLQAQSDDSNEEGRKPRPCSKAERKGVGGPLVAVRRSGVAPGK
ncbi:uncharacterized protein O9250_011757 isoform 2-T2 [Rhynochetos jubatus]